MVQLDDSNLTRTLRSLEDYARTKGYWPTYNEWNLYAKQHGLFSAGTLQYMNLWDEVHQKVKNNYGIDCEQSPKLKQSSKLKQSPKLQETPKLQQKTNVKRSDSKEKIPAETSEVKWHVTNPIKSIDNSEDKLSFKDNLFHLIKVRNQHRTGSVNLWADLDQTNLRKARKAAGLSLDKLATITGIPRNKIQEAERRVTIISREELEILANELSVDIKYIEEGLLIGNKKPSRNYNKQ